MTTTTIDTLNDDARALASLEAAYMLKAHDEYASARAGGRLLAAVTVAGGPRARYWMPSGKTTANSGTCITAWRRAALGGDAAEEALVWVELTRPELYAVKGIYFAVEVSPERDASRVDLYERPGYTNLGVKPLIRGWLGSTQGCSKQALGLWRVEGRSYGTRFATGVWCTELEGDELELELAQKGFRTSSDSPILYPVDRP